MQHVVTTLRNGMLGPHPRPIQGGAAPQAGASVLWFSSDGAMGLAQVCLGLLHLV